VHRVGGVALEEVVAVPVPHDLAGGVAHDRGRQGSEEAAFRVLEIAFIAERHRTEGVAVVPGDKRAGCGFAH
jgi:hypothetical protein